MNKLTNLYSQSARSLEDNDDELTLNDELIEDLNLRNVPLLSSNITKLAVNGTALSYYIMLLLTSERRLVMDYIHDENEKPFYSGGILDCQKKIYAEDGILGLFGKKEYLPSILQILATFTYTRTVREYIFLPLVQSDNILIRVGSSLMDNVLNSAITHPIMTTALFRHKRFDDMKKQKGFIEAAVQIYTEKGINGFYRGFGWAILQQAGTQVYKSTLSYATHSLLDSWIGVSDLDNSSYDSLETIEELTTNFIFDITTLPFVLSLSRYIGDQGSTYPTYIQCIRKMYQQEGLKGLYKGSWLGFFFN